MNILKRINSLKRNAMRKLTRNIGNRDVQRRIFPTQQIEIKRILISRPNKRLGNLLLITPLLQEVISTFPKSKIDLFVKGNLAFSVFKNYENVNIIELPEKPLKQLFKFLKAWVSIKIHHYDLAINVIKTSSSGRISTQFANAKYKFYGDMNLDIQLKNNDYNHIAKYPVYAFRTYLQESGFINNNPKIPSLNLKLNASEIADGKNLLKELVKNDKKTICLFTYATGDKCYSETWWQNFYERLKTTFPKENIIEVLPIQNVSKISFKAPTFSSKDIRKVGSLIANCDVFIGADGGVMHLSNAVNTPTIGFFSVTNHLTYMPYNNKSVGIKTNETDTDECIRVLHSILD